MRVAIASDHAGFCLKEVLREHLSRQGREVIDCGATSEESTDYPDYAKDVAGRVSGGRADRGVLVCGSGIGMCIAANRYSGVRAAVLRDEDDARMSRRHNDANVACLGGRVTGPNLAKNLIDIFFSTEFDGGRHEARVKKIDSKP